MRWRATPLVASPTYRLMSSTKYIWHWRDNATRAHFIRDLVRKNRRSSRDERKYSRRSEKKYPRHQDKHQLRDDRPIIPVATVISCSPRDTRSPRDDGQMSLRGRRYRYQCHWYRSKFSFKFRCSKSYDVKRIFKLAPRYCNFTKYTACYRCINIFKKQDRIIVNFIKLTRYE